MAAQDYISVVQQLYVSYFGRPADYYGLDNFSKALSALDTKGEYKTFAAISAAVQADRAGTTPLSKLVNSFNASAESNALYGTDNSQIGISKFVAAIYQNVLGREADTAGFNFWVNAITSGALTKANAAAAITAAAMVNTSAQGLLDAQTVANKLSVATSFTTNLDTPSEINAYAGDSAAAAGRSLLGGVNNTTNVTAYQTTVNDTITGLVNVPVAGSQIAFTKGLDTLAGTSGNDVFSGSVSASAELNTVSGLDVVNGGAGNDTLRIADETGNTITLPTLNSVEVVEVMGTSTVRVNTTATTGVNSLNVTKAGGNVEATAGAATNVNVGMKDAGSVTVAGGNNVNVNLTDATHAINVGAGAAADAAGNVTVMATGAAAINNTSVTMGTITVEGGKVISVTQKATSSSAAIVADGTTETHTQGNVFITANASTTDVTVKQDATLSARSTAAVAGVAEVATVKFGALAKGDSVTVGGLTFTAAKALTAAQVAQAFANLAAGAIKPGVADGDTQGSGVAANGVYTGSLKGEYFVGGASVWTTGAANGDTVVFTGEDGSNMKDLTASVVAGAGNATPTVTLTTTTQGVDGGSLSSRLGVAAGTVTVNGAAALKSVTIDGYAASTGAAGITGDANSALASVTLANGASFDIDSAATNLALSATAVSGTVNVAAGAKTIDATVNNSTSITTTLVSASAETLNVKGSASVAGNTTTGLTAATAINTSGMTGGLAVFTIGDGTKTAYTGGAGADRVTISNAGTAITKAVNLGAGNDRLVLEGTVVVPTATLSGGDGIDQIRMNSTSAAALSANGDFAAKIDGFERLYITDKVAAATTVNMSNMDGMTYVISNNSTAVAAAAVKEVFNADFSSSGAIAGADSVTFDGLTISLTGNETPAQIAAKFINQTTTNYIVTGVNGNVVSFQAKVAGVTTDAKLADFVVVDTDATTAAVAVTTTTQGDLVTAEAFSADFATSGAIEDADTIVFDGVTTTLASGNTPAQIAAAVAGKTYTNWTATVSGTTVNFVAKAVGAMTDKTAADFAITNVKTAATAPAVAVNVTTQGAAAGDLLPTLTIDKMVNDGTLELVAAGDGVIVKMADASGTADSFNIVTTVTAADLNFGTVTVAGVETIKLNATDASPTDAFGNPTIDTGTLALNADKATLVTVSGNSNLNLDVTKAAAVATIDGSTMTGKLSVAATGAVAMTITGGSGADTLRASVGVDAKADVINGGAGNDIIYVGSNGAKLTGGEGNDLFVLTAASATAGTKQANTYSEILDFKAGDLLQLQAFTGGVTANVGTTTKLAAVLNESTAQFSDFVDAAIKEAGAGAAVWFNYKGDLYVTIDNGTNNDAFVNGEDMIVKLTGINGDNLSFNAQFGTLALV